MGPKSTNNTDQIAESWKQVDARWIEAFEAFNERNTAELLANLLELSDDGYPYAETFLGVMYFSGFLEIDADIKKSVSYLKKSLSKFGDPMADLYLGTIYIKNYDQSERYSEGISHLLRAFDTYKTAAGLMLGAAFSKGKGVQKDHLKSIYYYKSAAESGHIGAKISYYSKRVRQNPFFVFHRLLWQLKLVFHYFCYGKDDRLRLPLPTDFVQLDKVLIRMASFDD